METICKNCVHWWGKEDAKYAACEYSGFDTESDSSCDGFIHKQKAEI